MCWWFAMLCTCYLPTCWEMKQLTPNKSGKYHFSRVPRFNSLIMFSISEIHMQFLLYFRKSLKSLFFLLPLLGVTNILHHLWPNPLRGPWPSFALWSFTTHFLYSFQGVFVASVYFLFDKKVIVLNNFVDWRIRYKTLS